MAKKEFNEGYHAFVMGEDEEDNPYYQDTKQYMRWKKGWNRAQKAHSKLKEHHKRNKDEVD